MKVLVLDDCKAFRDEALAMLTRNGHVAEAVESADAAIPLAEKGHYDFILVDFNMPGHDGAWFLQNVKLPQHTRALLVTAHAHKDILACMFKFGAAGYLIKPFDEDDLMRHLELLSARRHGEASKKRPRE
jgi:CheY-like chemotaxis protein